MHEWNAVKPVKHLLFRKPQHLWSMVAYVADTFFLFYLFARTKSVTRFYEQCFIALPSLWSRQCHVLSRFTSCNGRNLFTRPQKRSRIWSKNLENKAKKQWELIVLWMRSAWISVAERNNFSWVRMEIYRKENTLFMHDKCVCLTDGFHISYVT